MTSPPDHPRSRGVYTISIPLLPHERGSSPLARGLLHDLADPHQVLGIIPARAGFTRPLSRPAPASTDHPRSRGVYKLKELSPILGPGSSPLARGLLALRHLVFRGLRIIPARAGFTPDRSGPPDGLRDHPRSRGVYANCVHAAALLVGSSPLARGLRSHPGSWALAQRIIPARAGFTLISLWAHGAPPDHPRSRGVYSNPPPRKGNPMGSSPLARGLLCPMFR